ncbi:excalibur calcium-binding domain-containing protein [Flavobacterium gelatinilyticum]|uniref:excalibur calcium-binding domain-containing protein n=1 Tax=Flavobacterium gelatinilyticum TaxID=3003260 RepID=UPI00247FC5AF|nr:excalibur calcium-binding domain-containing protein [Flavobacterium gelatinilyticum]
MGYRKGYYRKNGTYVQGHFTNNRSRSFSGKNNGCVLLILVFIMLTSIISCSDSADDISNSGSNSNSSSGSNSDCPTKTCASFKTRAEAQAVYDSNRKCYKNLDADGDGRACESLK